MIIATAEAGVNDWTEYVRAGDDIGDEGYDSLSVIRDLNRRA